MSAPARAPAGAETVAPTAPPQRSRARHRWPSTTRRSPRRPSRRAASTPRCAPSTSSSPGPPWSCSRRCSALIALAIAAHLGRPVLYRGERVGRAGPRLHDVQVPHAQARTPRRASARTYGEELSRRTEAGGDARSGRPLRLTHLDELPQLWNVLRGDMSIVGPRPIRPAFFDELLRGDPAVLAAARRPAGRHRLRPDPDDPRGLLGGEARPRPRVHRGPLGPPLPARAARDRGADPHADAARQGPLARSPAQTVQLARSCARLAAMCGICGLVSLDGAPAPIPRRWPR